LSYERKTSSVVLKVSHPLGPILGSCGGCAELFAFISQGFDEGLECGCVGNRQKALASTKVILVR